jgi:hypothetical protein
MQNFNTFAGDVGPNDGGEETGWTGQGKGIPIDGGVPEPAAECAHPDHTNVTGGYDTGTLTCTDSTWAPPQYSRFVFCSTLHRIWQMPATVQSSEISGKAKNTLFLKKHPF